MQADIVIVGAGMVGCTLALALKESGLNIVVLESKATNYKEFKPDTPFEPRVSAISLASQKVLEHVNAWNGILARRLSPYNQMYVWDGSGTGYIEFNAATVHQPILGHIIENKVIQDALLEQLEEANQTITWLPKVELVNLQRTAEEWTISLKDSLKITAKLIIGADGARSKVRRLAAVKTREWDYFHHAIVTSVCCEKEHQLTAWQRFTDEGPLAFLPLSFDGDQHWCSIVWSLPQDSADALMALDDKAFCKKLGEAFEFKLGQIKHADSRVCLPLRQRHAKRYIQPGLALIGDAAHVIHPLAGQGVNLGFMDAAALAETLLEAIKSNENIDSTEVLGRFERNRMPHNLGMMVAMESFERVFQADSLSVRWLRNAGLKIINQSPEAKALFIRRALGIEGNLPKMAMF